VYYPLAITLCPGFTVESQVLLMTNVYRFSSDKKYNVLIAWHLTSAVWSNWQHPHTLNHLQQLATEA